MNVYPTSSNLEPTHKVTSTWPLPLDFDLPIMSLFGKIQGDSIPFYLIHIKTKRDWTQVKGQVDYVDTSNGWILFKFSYVHDQEFVWTNRPWFMSGVNLVLWPLGDYV